MPRVNSPAKKSTQRQLSEEELKFKPEQRDCFKKLGLSGTAIDELEKAVYTEYCLLLQGRSSPAARDRKKRLRSLLRALEQALSALDTIDDYTMRMNSDVSLLRFSLKPEIKKSQAVIETAISVKGKPGNTETDLDVMAYQVARIMLMDDIKPLRNGKKFQAILTYVFQLIGEDEKSVEAAIHKAWELKPSEAIRSLSIPMLIEQSKYGLDNENCSCD